MGLAAKIICKTAGVAGMSAVVYDAYARGKKQSARTSLNESADTFESVIAAERTTSSANPTTVALQEKVANFRMNNPISAIFGRVKGFFTGVVNSVVDNVVPVICSSMALAGKGRTAKAGVWGLGIYGVYKVLYDGFGIGKENPMGK